MSASGLQQQRQRLRMLKSLQQALRNYDVFDEEDLGFLDDAIEQENQIDEELVALQERLPVRQSILAELDRRYNLSEFFPELMTRFVEKDADLFALLEERQRAQKAYRGK